MKNPSCTVLSRKRSRFFICKGIFNFAIIPYLLVLITFCPPVLLIQAGAEQFHPFIRAPTEKRWNIVLDHFRVYSVFSHLKMYDFKTFFRKMTDSKRETNTSSSVDFYVLETWCQVGNTNFNLAHKIEFKNSCAARLLLFYLDPTWKTSSNWAAWSRKKTVMQRLYFEP